MSLQPDRIQQKSSNTDSRISAAQSVAGTSGVHLQDNHPRALMQRKQIDTMAAWTPIQRKQNNTGLAHRLKTANACDKNISDSEHNGNVIQRHISLVYGGDDDDPVVPSEPEAVVRWLESNGIKVDEIMRHKIYAMANDNEDRVYHGIFDERLLLEDINKFALSYIDRDSFALFKLLGPDTGPGYLTRKQLLDNATTATIAFEHIGFFDYSNEGYQDISGSDFPGKIWARRNELRISNILGQGRLKEIISYLNQIGIHHIYGAGHQNTMAIVAGILQPVVNILKGRKIDLSVMPVSIALKAQREGRHKLLFSTGPSAYSLLAFIVNDVIHLIVDIKWANGILIKDVLNVLALNRITFGSVNLHGIAGSLTEALPRDTLVAPRGDIHSLDPEHPEPVHIPYNSVFIPGAIITMDHGNVSSILEETDEHVRELLNVKQIHTVEMEAYHMIRQLTELGYTGDIKIVFTISDIATSPHENISIPPPRNAASLLAREKRDNLVIEAFGLKKK